MNDPVVLAEACATPAVPEWRVELKRIVDFLNTKTPDAKKLWWVLTALRGPDSYNVIEYKGATTAVIRHACGLRQGVGNGATVNPDSVFSARLRTDPPGALSYHFVEHARFAFEELGLEWDTFNEPGKQ